MLQIAGKQEATFGDIGLLVTVARNGAAPLTGVAYLEAKRRQIHTTRYPEFKTPQARRILQHAPRASLLLYDYEATTEFIGPLGFDLWSSEEPYINSALPARPVTKVRTLPLNTAVAVGLKDTRLHQYGMPLSIQLVARYLCGLDLEHSAKCVESITGRAGKLLPRRVAVINVVEGGGDVSGPPINQQVYARDE